MNKYVCPKCRAVIHSNKKPEYCVCGGKYKTAVEEFNDLMNGLGFGFLSGEQ